MDLRGEQEILFCVYFFKRVDFNGSILFEFLLDFALDHGFENK